MLRREVVEACQRPEEETVKISFEIPDEFVELWDHHLEGADPGQFIAAKLQDIVYCLTHAEPDRIEREERKAAKDGEREMDLEKVAKCYAVKSKIRGGKQSLDLKFKAEK